MTPGSAEAGVRAAFDEEIGKTVEIIATATEKDARSRCEVVFMGAILTCVTRHSKGLGFRRSLEGCDCAWAPGRDFPTLVRTVVDLEGCGPGKLGRSSAAPVHDRSRD